MPRHRSPPAALRPRRAAGAILALSAMLSGAPEALALSQAGALSASSNVAGSDQAGSDPALASGASGTVHSAAPTPPPDPLEAAQATFERVQQLYQESCGDRAYGAYDDLCEALGKEVRRSELEVDALKHKRDPPRSKTP